MKILNIFKTFIKQTKLMVALVMIGSIVAVPLAAHAEFFPDRPTFDYNKPCNPDDADRGDRCGSLTGPVFNSFINTPSYGDERAFLDARRSDQTEVGAYKNVLPDVTKGSQEVVLRVYIHNNANQGTNASGLGVATNTRVRIALPATEGSALRAVGYISARNATPQIVEDTVDLTSTESFTVAYKPGSAVIRNNGPFRAGMALPDSVVTTGTQIGWDALNGNFPGCFDYDAQVQITVKVTPKQTPKMSFTKQVRKSGTREWKSEVAAKPGEEVEWLLNTKNIGQVALTDVITRDVLPPHVSLQNGTVKFVNARGTQVLGDAPLFSGGYNAGRYDPNDNTLITFKTKVLDDFTSCEIRVRNVAHAKSAQTPTELTDNADVVITKENCHPEEKCTVPGKENLPKNSPECKVVPPAVVTPPTPTTLPVTGPGDVIGIFSAVSVVGALIHRFILSRRFNV